MKKKKKQIFAILMIFCMAVCYMPSFSFAAAESNAENTASNAIVTEEDLSKGGAEEGGSGAETDTETIDPKAQESSEDNIDAAGAELTEAIENDVKVSKEIEEEVLSAEEGENILLYTPILRAASIVDGTTINYTVTRIGEDNKKPLFHSGDYIGSCIQVGTSANDNGGTATVHALSKDNIIVKTVYYMHVVLKWWPSGTNSQINQAERAIQYASMPEAADRRMRELDYDEATIAKIHGYVQTASSITVPDSFEAFSADAGSDQDFIIYKYNEGAMQLQKQQPLEGVNFVSEAPNNYSLSGAVYEIYTDSNCTQRAYTPSGGQLVPVTLTTTESGLTNIVSVPSGTYYAKEITASKGFLLDSGVPGSTTARAIPVTVTTANTEANPAKINSTDDPTFGKLIKLRKKNENGDYGWRKLLGAQYTLRYYNVDPSTSDVAGLTPTRSWVFETTQKKDEKNNSYAGIDFDSDTPISGDDFYMETVGSKTVGSNEIYYFDDDPATSSEKRVMPIGVYTIEETKAPEGLSRNTTVYYGSVKQDSNGAFAVTRANTNSSDGMTIEIGTENDVVNDEDLQAVKIIINKYDKETEEQKAQGADRENVKGSLAGAVYEVYYDDNDRETPELVGTITTDENGYGELTKRTLGKETYIGTDLRVGNYLIKEVTASPGYVIDKYILNGENTEEITNGEIEVVCGYESDGTPVTKTIKGTYEDGQHLFRTRAEALDASVFEYTVKSEETPHHTYVSKINITDGKELPGATLQVFDSEGNMIEEWVSTDKPHDIVALHDETQGLKDGKYTLREITAPYGYDVAEDIEFTIESGKIANTVVMKDAPIEIKTTATDVETGTHQGTFSKEEKIKDLVKFKNLYAGRTYTFKGTLMDKKTGEALKDANGEPVTAEKDYTVPGEKGTLVSGEVELEFTVDASSFTKETSVVAFERIERDGRELAMHADLEDDDQTIHYGGIIRTIAKDENLVSHNVIGGPGSVIIDTIEYKNLSTKETYVIEGSIYDKTAGKLLGITAKANFKPATVDGTTTLKFTFDGTDLQNHTLVVFEKLSLNGTEIDKHEDPEDKDQTIYVPEIGTKADKAKSNKVTDRVAYKNLVPGQEYVMRGWLVSKSTGKKIDGSDGEVRFTPTQSSGYVDVTLKIKKGTGKLVAFEECYAVKGNVETKVGEHKDITDKDQAVTVEKGSHPKTGEDYMIYLYGGMFGLAALLAVVMRKKTLLKK